MASVAKRYAKALFEVAKESEQIDAIEEELNGLDQALQEYPQLRELLYRSHLNNKQKKEKITAIFGAHASDILLTFMKILIDNNRESVLDELSYYYVLFANRQRQIADAIVTSIEPLSEEQKQQLAEQFKPMFNKDVRVQNQVDPSILGGIIVKVGDRLYDGSIKGKLDRFEQRVLTSKS